jgi:cold shock CspA family protein
VRPSLERGDDRDRSRRQRRLARIRPFERDSAHTPFVPPTGAVDVQVRGLIKLIARGQGSGIITGPNRDVFFHKSDVRGAFWDLQVGDAVTFELIDDAISGPRAQNVQPLARPSKNL